MGTEDGILPAKTSTGIQVMSVNMLLEDETAPVVWRGPIIAQTVKQFWSEVIWQDVDFLFVDMPPGHRRRAADGVPIAARCRHCGGYLPAGAGFDDCGQSGEHGPK